MKKNAQGFEQLNLTVFVQLARTFKIWDQRLIFFFCGIAIIAIAILLPRK